MPHLPLTKEYSQCAFTQKNHKLARMLLSKGHEVFVYGVGYTDIEHQNFKYFDVVSMDDVKEAWGDGDNRFELGYDHSNGGFRHDINSEVTNCTKKFRQNTINLINQNKKDDDFLLLSQGFYHKPIAEAVNLYLTCEPGIGYRGSFAKFRSFESAYIQNFTYGSEHPRQSINGNYYDRVIPNYFDLDDFEFSDKPDDYLFYIGRIIIRKGVGTAIKVARYLDKKIVVAGQLSNEQIEGFHYNRYKKLEYVGTVGVEDRKKLLSKALVTFLPTLYLEPFGGTSVESMLSGTPAITTNFGVFPETVINGVSGYRCDTLDDFVQNTKMALNLDRRGVRDYAVSKFSLDPVNELYEKWWSDLYRLYQSTKDKNIKAWSFVKI